MFSSIIVTTLRLTLKITSQHNGYWASDSVSDINQGNSQHYVMWHGDVNQGLEWNCIDGYFRIKQVIVFTLSGYNQHIW